VPAKYAFQPRKTRRRISFSFLFPVNGEPTKDAGPVPVTYELSSQERKGDEGMEFDGGPLYEILS